MLKRFFKSTLGRTLLVGIIVLLVIYFRSQSGEEAYIGQSVTIPVQEVVQDEDPMAKVAFHSEPKLSIKDEDVFGAHYPSGDLREYLDAVELSDDIVVKKEEKPVTSDALAPNSLLEGSLAEQAWQRYSVEASVPSGWTSVAIVIDDLGENKKYSYEAIELEPPMTMALLPYSSHIDEMAIKAKQEGHEVIIHMPMEPMNADLDVGSVALKVGQSSEEFSDMLDKAFASMDGYAGINNHMGSKLTQDQKSMNQLMLRLKKEGLLFLDSRTISSSVASDTAKKYGVPYAVRDVFLDHDPSEKGVRKSLETLEAESKKYGHAIAIGHPKEATVSVLREWVKTLPEKKIALVPISYSVKRQLRSDQTAQVAQPQSGL